MSHIVKTLYNLERGFEDCQQGGRHLGFWGWDSLEAALYPHATHHLVIGSYCTRGAQSVERGKESRFSGIQCLFFTCITPASTDCGQRVELPYLPLADPGVFFKMHFILKGKTLGMLCKKYAYKRSFPGGLVVKNLPAMKGTRVQVLNGEDLLEKGLANTPVFLSGEFHGQRSLVDYNPCGCK